MRKKRNQKDISLDNGINRKADPEQTPKKLPGPEKEGTDTKNKLEA